MVSLIYRPICAKLDAMTPAKILVVDDDPLIRKHLQTVLTHEGYQVATAESGEAALEKLAADTFDVALLDIKMPGVDGMEVLARLRHDSPGTIAIILTGHATLETVFEALRQGAHDYLFKPCRASELRESVKEGLRRRQTMRLHPSSPRTRAL